MGRVELAVRSKRLQLEEGKLRMENPEMPRYCCCDVIKGAWVWSILWMIVSCLSFLSATQWGGYVVYSILSIVFCALVMHGLKTMNHKLIMPALIFIPISSIGIVIGLTLTLVAAATVTAVCTQDVNYGHISTSCNNDVAAVAGSVLAVAFTLLAIAAGIWIAAWISFYKAYKYIMQSIRNTQQAQQVPLQPQQGMAPQVQQGYPPQPQQGYPPQPQ